MLKNKYFLICFISLITSINCFSQSDDTTRVNGRTKRYALILYLSSGLGYFPSNGGAPAFLNPKISRFNPITTARIMWRPDHRLKAGFESGYMTFYSYKLKDEAGNEGEVSLNAIPILLEFSVVVKKHLNLFAGPGVYILDTKLDYAGKASSKKVSTGWMAAAAYAVPLNRDVSIATEAKWLYAAETLKGSFGLQLQVLWKFLKW